MMLRRARIRRWLARLGAWIYGPYAATWLSQEELDALLDLEAERDVAA